MQPPLRQLGLVVHPTRPIERALREIQEWASAHDVAVGQVATSAAGRQMAEPVEAGETDVLLALGGDGTALTALHAGAPSEKPVLAIACGSLGVLTSVTADKVASALDQFADGRWTPSPVPGLEIDTREGPAGTAINDLALIRDSPGQIAITITLDGVLYARVAGDGLIVATALGSSAYTMAAGGPLLAPGADAFVVTPITPHGGSCPPLVAGGGSQVELALDAGRVGVRHELDGRRMAIADDLLRVRQRPDYATLVRLADADEPRLTGLRRHGLVSDSPRVTARLARNP
jgi:NAD+ kinase